jgi:hypothetical protein
MQRAGGRLGLRWFPVVIRFRRMKARDDDDQYSPEETARRAREAIRRSFEMPYKPQKDLVGKVGNPNRGRPKLRSRPVDKGQDQT